MLWLSSPVSWYVMVLLRVFVLFWTLITFDLSNNFKTEGISKHYFFQTIYFSPCYFPIHPGFKSFLHSSHQFRYHVSNVRAARSSWGAPERFRTLMRVLCIFVCLLNVSFSSSEGKKKINIMKDIERLIRNSSYSPFKLECYLNLKRTNQIKLLVGCCIIKIYSWGN